MIGDIRQSLDAMPFEPFTVVTSSGRHYGVQTRDHAGLNPRGSRLVIWFDDDSSITISNLHIVAVEKGMAMNEKGSQQANGGNA